MGDLVTLPTPRDTQFAGFAELLSQELKGWELSKPDVKKIIARRAYDLAEHTVGYCLDYLHECGFELSGTMNSRIQPSIPDMTTWPEVNHG